MTIQELNILMLYNFRMTERPKRAVVANKY
jgi:hypothetical protein